MNLPRLGDLALSRFMLGTVQLGMNYGIANRTGQPSYEQARDILACAYQGGVTCFDTAAAYGTSEEILGRALAELGIADKVVVVTKIRRLEDAALSHRAAAEMIEASVASSLRALCLEALPICLFHREQDFRYADGLLRLKEKGLVRHMGASVMTPEAARDIMASDLAEAIQVPANVVDRRFVRQGTLEQAQRGGVGVFVRSVYLQGLLLMPEAEIPPHLRAVIPRRRELEALARAAGMSLAELAVRYVLGLDGLTCALVGVESVEQMRQNLSLFARGPLEPALMQAIAELEPELPEAVVMPTRWFQRAEDRK
jgi:aryl-alcohol dehydrogenase-like predicted oxidoreductase